MKLKTCARSSLLSKMQVQEVLDNISLYHSHVEFDTTFLETTGDKDQKTSLRALEKTDFFTKEIDEYQLSGFARISIHSAKDLPDPLPKGLAIAAITEGVNSSDSLVMREGESLKPGDTIATSSERREEAVKKLCSNLKFIDLRGNILDRLSKLEKGEADSIVIAEAALIRLNLTKLNRITIPCQTPPMQGKLAIVIREDDKEMADLFSWIDYRHNKKKTLYFGINPSNYKENELILHYPIIQIVPREFEMPGEEFTHIIFTSKYSAYIFFKNVGPKYFLDKKIITIGKATAKTLEKLSLNADIIPKTESSEGIVEELSKIDLSNASFLWPRSSLSRDVIPSFFRDNQIRYKTIEIYDTIPHHKEPKPQINLYDKLIFTSPSTIDAFLEIFGPIPHDKEIATIGPVTKESLAKKP